MKHDLHFLAWLINHRVREFQVPEPYMKLTVRSLALRGKYLLFYEPEVRHSESQSTIKKQMENVINCLVRWRSIITQ